MLHTYGEVEGIPPGVATADANRLWPEERLLRYANNGSYALSANLMRYQIMSQGLGLYVDCDVYCMRPMDDADYVFGWQDASYINCAVLKLPPDSPITMDLAAIAEGWIPPWRANQPPRSLNNYPWGTTGPSALTYFVQKHGLERLSELPEVFYPVHYGRWQDLVEPGKTLADITTPRSRYVHLWHQLSKGADIPPGSPLDEMIRTAEYQGD